jgi:hypothetical protein
MHCPRCGGDFETYTMWGRDATVCGSCGYVGVSVEHKSDREERESWDHAIRRFYERNTTATVEDEAVDDDAAVLTEVSSESENDPDSADEADETGPTPTGDGSESKEESEDETGSESEDEASGTTATQANEG